ncbi:MAG: HAD family hydrolase [bacterium]|nr:HAD family hydrolase [bacterium]
MSAYRGVLFDLFGTLVLVDESRLSELTIDGRTTRTTLGDVVPLVQELIPEVAPAALWHALRTVSAEMAASREDTHVEHPSRERFRRALATLGIHGAHGAEVAVALSRAHMRGIAAATVFPPSHAAVLAAARRDGPVGVVSNFDDTATAYEILRRHGILPHLATVVVSEAVGVRKPHPAIVREALRCVGVAASEALFVGDTLGEDVAAAVAAGVDAAWIDRHGRGVPAGTPPPRYVLHALPDLLPVLA